MSASATRERMRWRRLDVPGTDECALVAAPAGWLLEGTAEFAAGSGAARLHYMVECDQAWRTVHAEVRGAVGDRPIELLVDRTGDGEWRVGGVVDAALDGLVDLDLGFTPATNLLPIRRLALRIGESAAVETAWLDDTTWRLARLPQRYDRRDATTYRYESPTTGYTGPLTVTAGGFVREYPGLWSAVE